jgi:hypothetical protein
MIIITHEVQLALKQIFEYTIALVLHSSLQETKKFKDMF